MLYSHLLHIKSSSEQWKKCHNLILASELKNKDNPILTTTNVGAIFKIVNDPEFLNNYKEQNTKVLIFSIELSAKDLASHFGLSRVGAMMNLKILKDKKILDSKTKDRTDFYYVPTELVFEVSDYLEKIKESNNKQEEK